MSAPTRGSTRTVLVLLGCVLVLALWWWAAGRDDAGTASPSPSGSTSSATSSPRSAPRSSPADGLSVVAVADLPREARTTLRLIEQGGPFPYRRDGVVFENRERLLPAHPRGWYHEYTVATPGEDDRGARRIVTGRDGERYWSDDHYDSFARIEEGT